MAQVFFRPDIVYRTGIPLPFSISTFRPNAQIIPSFRRAYGQSDGLNGAVSMVSTDLPIVSIVLNNVRAAAQGRPMVIQTARKASAQDALAALWRGRTR